MGGRRKRNIRDNLLVIYATINEAVRSKKEIDIQFYENEATTKNRIWQH